MVLIGVDEKTLTKLLEYKKKIEEIKQKEMGWDEFFDFLIRRS